MSDAEIPRFTQTRGPVPEPAKFDIKSVTSSDQQNGKSSLSFVDCIDCAFNDNSRGIISPHRVDGNCNVSFRGFQRVR